MRERRERFEKERSPIHTTVNGREVGLFSTPGESCPEAAAELKVFTGQ